MSAEGESKGGCGSTIFFVFFLVWIGTRCNQIRDRQAASDQLLQNATNSFQNPMPDLSDIQEELKAFIEVEERIIAKHNQTVELAQLGKLSDEEALRIVEEELLRPWREHLKKLESLEPGPPSRQVLAKVIQYMKLREKSWELLAESIRTENPLKALESRMKASEADRMTLD